MTYDTKIREKSLEQILQELGVSEIEQIEETAQKEYRNMYTNNTEPKESTLTIEDDRTFKIDTDIQSTTSATSLIHALKILLHTVNDDIVIKILENIKLDAIIKELENYEPEVGKIVKLALIAHKVIQSEE